MTKRKQLLVCFTAGVLLLAVSAAAAFGSVNGYTTYKEAVKALAFEADNFTAEGTVSMTYDGKAISTLEGEFAMDGANLSSHTITEDTYGRLESYDTVLNGVRTDFTTNDDVYYQSNIASQETGTVANALLGLDPDDELTRRMTNFAELALDTVVGELKNNFVQVGKEDGVTRYQVEIAQNQVPSLVNAGLSLFAYSVNAPQDYTYIIDYEDYAATALHTYETQTGQTLPADFVEGYCNGGDEAWWETYGDLSDQVNEAILGWEDSYYDVLEEKGQGVVYVKADGTYEYYATNQAYLEAHPETLGSNPEDYVGQDLNLQTVLCTFGVDSQGRLTDTKIQVNFNTVDREGSHHDLVLTGEVALSQYGTTTIQPLDVGDRTLQTY